jgi:ADP-ribosylglycohydrolase
MAAAIAVLAGGGTLAEALARARQEFPPNTWIAYGDHLAQTFLATADTPEDLALLLSTRLINTVYSYGNAASETFPAALAIVAMCSGDLSLSCLVANSIPKSADSLPAMAGALCGAYQGTVAIPARWQAQLVECRGICLPFLKGMRLDEQSARLVRRMSEAAGYGPA